MPNTIVLTQREFFSYCIIGAIASFTAGVALFAIFMALVVLPNRDAETLSRVESAYVKGAMLKIAASKARCQQWELKQRKAVCSE
jgi:hypothetical protein